MRPVLVLSWGALAHLAAWGVTLAPAPALSAPGLLSEVVISATRTPTERQQVAASVDVVDADTLSEMGPQINLSEGLQRVPGLAVLNRQNYAQDLQISSRGFGARAPFGVRGVRLYADGIPATMPDGQGQSALFDIASAERIEVLRGPASVLYGNAAGGVVQVFTQDGPAQPTWRAGVQRGADGLSRVSLQWLGETRPGASPSMAPGGTPGGATDNAPGSASTGRWPLNYVFGASQFSTDGWREHSAARRSQLNAKLRWALAPGESLTLVANYLSMPRAQDPLGLDAAALSSDPRGVAPVALAFDTRKTAENAQAGLVYERPLRDGHDALRVMVYGGTRQVTQFQAIPVAPQASAAHPGGVIDFARLYGGLDARYTWRGTAWSRALSVTAGLNLDDMLEDRQGYQNFVGATTGVRGELRRDERNRARNLDQYVQAQWQVAPAWALGLGARRSRVSLRSSDRYVRPGNGDDSGALHFAATTPTASLLYQPASHTSVYVSAARSFETPTLGEVAYQSSLGSSTGWNLALRPSRGEHLEVGIKSRAWAGVQLAAAAFHVDTDDEIGAQSSGGRAVYRNVGRTERHGAEVAATWQINRAWQAYLALTWTHARYQDSLAASASGVGAITAGHSLPGVPLRQAFAELNWRPAGQPWHTALAWRHSGRLWANDANDAYAPASGVLDWRLAWHRALGTGWVLDALARVDNVSDQRVVGSVIVNEGNRRYFEPAPGRSLMLGLTVSRAY